MLFNSFEFLIFLPLVFFAYWFLCKGKTAKNILLIFASYLFYGWWDYRFLLLIILITVVAFLGGIAITNKSVAKGWRDSIFWSCLLINFGTLFVFKYFNFFTQSFVNVLETVGFTPDVPTLDIILPVGISFYTFQASGYLIDVKRGLLPASRDVPAFFVFISFFPQLVAGPIERATNLLPQFLKEERIFTYQRGVSGMKLILWGLFKKMVVADNAASAVNMIFENWTGVGTLNLWIGAFLFSFQIYGDFSGYSDIAIGSARLFGIDLMKNFSLPYFSRDITEFWKKWHISLTGWFRDYVYIPLGGNRKGKGRTIGNTAAVFIVSGLWHGANFTYLLWGAYHAALFLPFRIYGKKNYKNEVPVLKESLLMGVTFLFVMIGWVIFRAETIGDAFSYIGSMFYPFKHSEFLMGKIAILWVVVFFLLEWLGRKKETPLDFSNEGILKYKWLHWAFCLVLFVITVLFAGQTQEFIYFKF